MKILQAGLVFILYTVVVIANPLQPLRKSKTRRHPMPPKYIVKIFETTNKSNLHCIFPKVTRTKRAIKLVFQKNSLNDEKNWKRDELRLFMSAVKGQITSSNKPYHVKIFDLYSRRLANVYKFSSRDSGWKTIHLTGWREIKRADRKGRFGIKIVVVHDKKKLTLSKTAFRKNKIKFDPYFIEYFEQEKAQTKETEATGDLFRIAQSHNKRRQQARNTNRVPVSKYDLNKLMRDYFLPFQDYDISGGLD